MSGDNIMIGFADAEAPVCALGAVPNASPDVALLGPAWSEVV